MLLDENGNRVISKLSATMETKRENTICAWLGKEG